jgi:hypothetical protein
MRTLISLLASCLLAWPCAANPLLMLAGSPMVDAAPSNFDYDVDWEETGAPPTANTGLVADVTRAGSTEDWDFSVATAGFPALGGSECLALDGLTETVTLDIANSSLAWVRGTIVIKQWPSSTTAPVAFRNGSGLARTMLRVGPAGQAYLFTNGGDTSASATTLALDTLYWFWLSHDATGGTARLYMSTTRTRPTVDGSGSVVLSGTNAASVTADIIRLQGTSATAGDDIYIGNIYADNAEITD